MEVSPLDNPVDGETGASSIAMIVKNGKIDYWRQIETAFRGICQEKDLEARYYATSAENGYQEQLAAVAELRKLDNKKLKGIIFTPSYGLNGESAEADVAALAKELDIPVVILDSPVSASSSLASYPYFGTDNTAAGQAMADKVMADKVAVFAMTNSPGMERAEDNLGDDNVKPFLEFYNKQTPSAIDGLAEKLLGKWIKTDKNGQPLTTDGKMVYDFVSATKAYMSASIDASPEVGTHKKHT